ncbi:MAG TPA: hypothetical protein VFQ35_02050 [Polyangiaceae bacterium]|nr:hypothetical protein [Polyangiaceae bacterium]
MTFELEQREREAFLDLLSRLVAPSGALAGFFSSEAGIGVARAPGRLDVMGGIADYSGSLVLELPLAEGACAAAQLHPDPELWVASVAAEAPHDLREARLPIGPLFHADYEQAARLLRRAGLPDFLPYLAGLVVPLRSKGLPAAGGVRLVVSSRVPEGRGVASSAAIEVAGFFALAAAAGLHVEASDAAELCQRVENLVVGAPCGIMDQMAVACGRREALLELLCQPASMLGFLRVPPELAFFGIDSGVRHSVSGREYRTVRSAAFMGYRLLVEHLGFGATRNAEGALLIDDARFRGYLANVTPSELDSEFRDVLPERLSGAEFIERFGDITDSATRLEPTVSYPVRAATEHPIREHHRVRCFAELLGAASSASAAHLMGELMYQSHASYSACGLGSAATDRLVRLVREAGIDSGLYGAKITGGGAGGTVAVLARRDASRALAHIAERYAEESGQKPRIFSGSSAGAAEFGTMNLPGATLAPSV